MLAASFALQGSLAGAMSFPPGIPVIDPPPPAPAAIRRDGCHHGATPRLRRQGASPRAFCRNGRFEDVVFQGVLRRDWPGLA